MLHVLPSGALLSLQALTHCMPSHFVPVPHRALTQPSTLLQAAAQDTDLVPLAPCRLRGKQLALAATGPDRFGTGACETKTGCQLTGFIQVRVRCCSCRDQRMPWSRMCPARALFPGTLSHSAILHSTVQPSSPALSRFQGHMALKHKDLARLLIKSRARPYTRPQSLSVAVARL